MINENNRINPSELKIIDHAIPRLQAGKYKLCTTQTVQLRDGKTAVYKNEDTSFEVAAPRFAIDPLLVYSEYPRKEAKGSYSTTLPNVVFKRKTLLWERKIGADIAPEVPWMCLLLFEEDELKEHKIELKHLLMKDIFADAKDIIKPVIEAEASDLTEMKTTTSDTPKYPVIDVPCPLLNDLIPYKDELKYLAHARQVDTLDKEKQDSNAKGWYSVLIGNRLPAQDKNHIAFVVSLEGHQALLDGKKLTEAGNAGKSVRLVVLHSWDFISKGEDFETLVRNIDGAAGPLRMDVDRSKVKDDTIIDAFNYGYTAINHEMRNGSRNISWYRGPLVPVQIPTPDVMNFKDADAALLFDERSAMFDITYSSAWQIGRLLGLHAPGYMSAVSNWKKNFESEIRLNMAQGLLKKKFENSFAFEDVPENNGNENNDEKKRFTEAVTTAESDDFLNSLLGELWAKIKING
jgi:hypothetical protein